MACLFCKSDKVVQSPYEDTLFNNKVFKYLKCGNCQLVYVSPLPTDDDFMQMYPTSYQGDLIAEANGYYNWLFDDVKKCGQYKGILDYGCGNGKFVLEALSKGYDVTGVEFNPTLVSNLKEKIPQADFLTVSAFLEQRASYDIIFLGNVLEHLTNPKEMLLYLKSRLNKNGLLILEGPIEDNFTIAGTLRKFFFNKRKHAGNKVYHAPRHIFYANYDNQLAILTSIGLEKIKYNINENSWPFPGSIKACRSIKDFAFWTIAVFSRLLGNFFPKSGNVFYYIGRLSN